MKQILSLISLLLSSVLQAQPLTEAIRLNQVGYYYHLPKVAVVAAPAQQNIFYLVDAVTADTVFRGRLGDERNSANSSLTTRMADFSSWQKDGRYYIAVPGLGKSYSFAIGKGIHRAVADALLK